MPIINGNNTRFPNQLPNQNQTNVQNPVAQNVQTAQTAQTAQTQNKNEIPLAKPADVTTDVRNDVALDVAKKLIGTAQQFKDIQGNGMEWTGAGDPRINQRRSVLSTLLSSKASGIDMSALNQLGPNVAADLQWIKSAEHKEYTLDGKNQFSWSQNQSSTPQVIQAEFEKRVKSGQMQADALATGSKKYMDATSGTVVSLAFMKDPELRTKSLVDALLQFRVKGDKSSPNARIATIGPAAIAEQRVVLAKGDFNPADQTKTREYALTRLMVLSHPNSSMNGIFEARNAVAKMEKSGCDWVKNGYSGTQNTPPGATYCAYESIHHNFSSATPKNIEQFVKHFIFTKGPEESRPAVFQGLMDAMRTARDNHLPAEARKLVESMAKEYPGVLDDLMSSIKGQPDSVVGDKLLAFLVSASPKKLGTEPEENLKNALRLYNAVCEGNPTVSRLESNLFHAGEAWPEIADVVQRMRSGDHVGLLKDLGDARLALRDAVVNAKTGHERHDLLKFDGLIDRLTSETLGTAVDRLGDLKTDGQKAEALLALQTALRSTIASGLHTIKSPNDAAANKGRPLDVMLKDIDAAMAKGKVSGDEYRALMGEAYLGITRTIQNIRSYVDSRAADVANGGVNVDPEFMDQLVKQSPLHYATAIAQKGMRAGLQEEIGARLVKNVEGMRVLNSVGPVVFTDVVFAENTQELIKRQPSKDAMSVLFQLQEKKMVAVGGLIADVKHAPGGNSHLNMYAMNNGITVLALPELRTKYSEFFKNSEKEGGIYIDDSNGEFRMMTVDYAKEQGLITDAMIPELKPGTNKRIKYLKPEGDAFSVLHTHDAVISQSRPMREIELYVPMEEVKGMGRTCASFNEIATLGTQGRHLSGEKGLVLALLKADPTLGKYVPDGSVVTTGRIVGLLKESNLWGEWEKVWNNDPKVGVVNDQNFLKSAFYTDANYRAKARDHLQHVTLDKLTSHLIAKDAKGNEVLTPAGQKLYDELAKNPALAQSDNWIARSSFTGEDRPNKSGAGQYESFPHLKNPVDRVKGVIGVVESTWMPEPIENNVADQIFLKRIMPSVTVQHCLNPQFSGVMISRDVEHGTRNMVSYQLVKGFGGGVEGGKTEEGLVTAGGQSIKIHYPGEAGSMLPESAMKELHKVVIGVEKFFNDVVEPGRGEAVDMEVAYVNGKWNIVQARVIGLDH